MKYTINGFSQSKLIEYELDSTDANILRYVVDFWNTNKMMKVTDNGKDYFWLKYDGVIEALPIINMKKEALSRRFKKYCDSGLMERFTKRDGGTFSCYRFTDLYLSLIDDDFKVDQTTQKSEGYDSKVVGGTTQKSEQKISLLKEDSSIKDNNNMEVDEVFNCYPNVANRKSGCSVLRSKTRDNKIIKKLLKKYNKQTMIKAIDNYINGTDEQYYKRFDNFLTTDNIDVWIDYKPKLDCTPLDQIKREQKTGWIE